MTRRWFAYEAKPEPHILAEIAADTEVPFGEPYEVDLDQGRLGAAEMGEPVTEAELLATPDGRRALERWRAGDDSVKEASDIAGLALMFLEDLESLANQGDLEAAWLLDEGDLKTQAAYVTRQAQLRAQPPS